MSAPVPDRFDFRGAAFGGGDLSGAELRGRRVVFDGVTFAEGTALSFEGADLTDAWISFVGAVFRGDVSFEAAMMRRGLIDFERATFAGGTLRFTGFDLRGGTIRFDRAALDGGAVSFAGTTFGEDGVVTFDGARFAGSEVSFAGADFSAGGVVDLAQAESYEVSARFDPWSARPPGLFLPTVGFADDE
ncbi:uncharacterized protein YjbI with pentapeptide repeats [Allocatelliglobosispora scoriae]|uniref:Uncharacterized protein YjbI with pentapeptide repeats n=1 Tax=Allocatelliglobosispora scoriae TaxID=643052 RepID=A0A841C290_9ACTN|nr:pentapeptide repeat-containing protein [Allocatelliglobosispora scoriae]MBB5873253.1 uncharacterized protein YjbI with pentapeptide repeats [Allocatelliglobosispora scoriae]